MRVITFFIIAMYSTCVISEETVESIINREEARLYSDYSEYDESTGERVGSPFVSCDEILSEDINRDGKNDSVISCDAAYPGASALSVNQEINFYLWKENIGLSAISGIYFLGAGDRRISSVEYSENKLKIIYDVWTKDDPLVGASKSEVEFYEVTDTGLVKVK